jgi:hypothetical protein
VASGGGEQSPDDRELRQRALGLLVGHVGFPFPGSGGLR